MKKSIDKYADIEYNKTKIKKEKQKPPKERGGRKI